jgi:hypothetical protein
MQAKNSAPIGALKIKQAAEYLGGLSTISVRRLIKRGLIKSNRALRHVRVQTRLHFPSEVGSPLFLQRKRNRGKEHRDCDNTIRRKRSTPKRGLGLNQDQHDTKYNDADFPPR